MKNKETFNKLPNSSQHYFVFDISFSKLHDLSIVNKDSEDLLIKCTKLTVLLALDTDSREKKKFFKRTERTKFFLKMHLIFLLWQGIKVINLTDKRRNLQLNCCFLCLTVRLNHHPEIPSLYTFSSGI